MVKKVIILGNHIQALGLSRQINQLGIEVLLITDTKYSITRFSNSLSKSIILKTSDAVKSYLFRYPSSKRDTLIFPTNDSMVYLLSTYYNELESKYYLGLPKPEVVNTFLDKRNTYKFALKNDIPCPKTWFPDTLEDVKNISKGVAYPVIIKPALMHTFHRQFGKKAFQCNDSKELFNKALWISQSYSVNNLIIQELIKGGPKNLYSYGAFAAEGKVYASLMANRIRQNPMDFGNSTTFAITCNIPEIRELSHRILTLTRYFGLAEVEFMYDETTKTYKFLEINARAWKWHTISNILGFNFIQYLIGYYNNNTLIPKISMELNKAWVERLTDLFTAIKSCFSGKLNPKEIIQSYKLDKEYAVWDTKDLKPFLVYLLFSLILYFKRH